jgi:hypothetical protein
MYEDGKILFSETGFLGWSVLHFLSLSIDICDPSYK